MASPPTRYTLNVGRGYTVTREGTTCTIQVGMDFFSPKLKLEGKNESRPHWLERATGQFFEDLAKISWLKKRPEFHTSDKVVLILEQENNWGNIQGAVEEAFKAHLRRKANGDYER